MAQIWNPISFQMYAPLFSDIKNGYIYGYNFNPLSILVYMMTIKNRSYLAACFHYNSFAVKFIFITCKIKLFQTTLSSYLNPLWVELSENNDAFKILKLTANKRVLEVHSWNLFSVLLT